MRARSKALRFFHPMSLLQSFVDHTVLVVTLDGRVLVVSSIMALFSRLLTPRRRVFQGTLRGTDASTNLILEKCQERVFSMDGTEVVPLGLYLIRGDSICTVGLVDEEKEAAMDLAELRAEPLASMHA